MIDDVMVNRERAQVRTVHIPHLPSYKTWQSTPAAAVLYEYEVVISHLLPLPLPLLRSLYEDVEQVITTITMDGYLWLWAVMAMGRHGMGMGMVWYGDGVWLIPLRLLYRYSCPS